MRGFGLLTTFIVVALTATLVELRSVRSRTRRDIPTECPEVDPIDTTIHLAHESNCSLFYKCYLGEKILYSCPTGVYFNPELQVCDWPESVGCALTGTSESEGTDTDSNHNAGDSEDNEESEDAEPESSDDTDNHEDANGSEGAEESEDAAEPEAVPEVDTEIVIPTECPAENGEYAVHIAHETDCSKFYLCNHGEKVEQQCASGLGFNPTLQVCDWAENVGCTLSGSTDNDDSHDSGAESENDEPESSDDTENHEDANGSEGAEESEDAAEPEAEPEDENEVVIPTECPAENGEYAVHIAHETDCSKFYLCNHGEKVEQQCASGLGFNPTLQVCDWAENVGCTLSGSTDNDDSHDSGAESENDEPESSDDTDNHEDADGSEGAEESEDAAEPEAEPEDENEVVIPTECPAENGEYAVHIAHETDCSKFYLCNHGEKVEQQCASGLGFNPTLQVCDWAENVGCTLSGSTDNDDSHDSGAESENDEPESSDDTDNHEDADGSEGAEESEDAAEPEDENEVVIPTECPAENGEYAVHIAHESDCSKFYLCNHGEKVEQQCASGLGFNPELQVCDWAENVGCTLSGSTDNEDSHDSGAESENDEPESSDDTENHEDANGSEGAEESEDAAEPEAEPEDENEVVIPTECPAENGEYAVHIAHETDCSKFYLCNHGEKVEQQCASGLGFNPTLQVCDWAENVGCTLSGSTDNDGSHDSGAESENDEPESSDDTENHEDANGSEGAEESEDAAEPEAVPEEDTEIVIPTECPAENGEYAVHIAHETDCSKFYLCNHGEKVEQQCASGLGFNPTLQVCDWAENVGCTLSGSTDNEDSHDSGAESENDEPESSDDTENHEDANGSEGAEESEDAAEPEAEPEDENEVVIPTECPAENGEYAVHIAHETDCSKFYLCNHGEKVEQQCASGLGFNPELQVCDWAENVGCTLSGSTDNEDSHGSGAESENDEPESSDDTDNHEDADGSEGAEESEDAAEPEDENEVVIPTECPAENGEYAVHIAHETDCSKFYLCNHGEKVEQQCASGLGFNPTLQVCDWAENVGCTLSGSTDSDDSDDSTESEDTGSVAPDDSDDSTDSEETASVSPDDSDDSTDSEETASVAPDDSDDSTDSEETVSVAPDDSDDSTDSEETVSTAPDSSDDSTDSEHTPSVTPDDSDESTDSEDSGSVAPDQPDNSNDSEDATETEDGSGDASGTESGTVIATECPAENGEYAVHLAHESDCGKYYVCNHGEKIERECPDGLKFNAALQVCDWPETAGCTLSGSSDSDSSDDPTDSEHTPSVSPDDSDDSTDSEDTGSAAPDHSDNSNDAEDATEPEAGSGDASGTESGTTIITECPAENSGDAVHLAHESDCGKYYVCDHGEKIERECPNGLQFNAALQVCDWPENAECTLSGSSDSDSSDDSTDSEHTPSVTPDDTDDSTDSEDTSSAAPDHSGNSNDAEDATETEHGSGDSSGTESGTVIATECPAENGDYAVHLAHESDCGKYYVCNHGEKIERECPDGLKFNPALQVCDWPETAGCTLSGSSDSDSSDDSTDSEHTPSVSPDDSDDSTDSEDTGSAAPDHSDNSNDAEDATETEAGSGDASGTESGTTIITECPAENSDDAVHLAHESDCGKYYVCDHGEKIERECPNGLKFNAALQVCDWPEFAGCSESASETEASVTGHDVDDATVPSSSSEITESVTQGPASTGDCDLADTNNVCPVTDPIELSILFAHSDADKFCICSNGVAYVLECPDGLLFNDELKVCDWPPSA